MEGPPEDILRAIWAHIADACDPDVEEQAWEESDLRELLADYGPEDEGLYDDPPAIGAKPVVW